MELKLSTKAGSGSSIELSDAVFARDFNEALIHQVVTAYMAGARAGHIGSHHLMDQRLVEVAREHRVGELDGAPGTGFGRQFQLHLTLLGKPSPPAAPARLPHGIQARRP